MADLSALSLKLVDDSTTLVYSGLSQVPAEEFEAAKTEVIAKLTALQATGIKPAPIDVVVSFVNTLDDVSHETSSVGFQKVADVIDTVVVDIADGSFNLFKEISAAINLKKAAKQVSAEVAK